MTMLDLRPTTSRLLRGTSGHGRLDLARHLRAHGHPPVPERAGGTWGESLLSELERSGLTGRGGAGFPSHRKALSVRAAGGRPVLVVNAMEGEPASAKDQFLLAAAPHLVLDGAELMAAAVGAARVVVCLPDDRPGAVASVTAALSERRALNHHRPPFEVARLAGRYVAGEESALVAAASGKAGVPAFRPDKSLPLALGRQPALVHNAETLAHVALIARYGAGWFAEVGSAEAPGTCLVTVSGGVRYPGVVEVEIGTPIEDILARAQVAPGTQAALVGGYGGVWLGGEHLGAPYSPSALRRLGASMGAGVLVALPSSACGLRETQRVAHFMAGESAGQCGPCVFGLPSIAEDLDILANGEGDEQDLDRLRTRCGLVTGRGACRHPDGVSRLVQSALQVFGADLRRHLEGAPCPGSKMQTLLAFPTSTSRPGGMAA